MIALSFCGGWAEAGAGTEAQFVKKISRESWS